MNSVRIHRNQQQAVWRLGDWELSRWEMREAKLFIFITHISKSLNPGTTFLIQKIAHLYKEYKHDYWLNCGDNWDKAPEMIRPWNTRRKDITLAPLKGRVAWCVWGLTAMVNLGRYFFLVTVQKAQSGTRRRLLIWPGDCREIQHRSFLFQNDQAAGTPFTLFTNPQMDLWTGEYLTVFKREKFGHFHWKKKPPKTCWWTGLEVHSMLSF